MGKIYTFKEIAEGTVPTRMDFSQAQVTVAETLQDLISNGSIAGAKMYGSVARGTAGPRSDFDLAIVYNEPSVLLPLSDLCAQIYSKHHISIQPALVSKAEALSGDHTLDRLLLGSILRASHSQIFGIDISTLLHEPPTEIPALYQQYMANKQRKLRDRLLSPYMDDKLTAVQRSLEGPANIGRKALQTYDHMGFLTFDGNDSKEAAIAQFRREFVMSPHIVGFNQLLAQDELYNTFLLETLDGHHTEAEYNELIDTLIHTSVPQCIEWVDGLRSFHRSILEGNLPTIEGQTLNRIMLERR